VKEGLKPGERIVLHGIQKVRPGIEVRPELTEPTRDPMASVTATSAMEEPDAVSDAPGVFAGADGTQPGGDSGSSD